MPDDDMVAAEAALERFTEMADDIIDEYMGFARTATATMAKDAFAQMDERYPSE